MCRPRVIPGQAFFVMEVQEVEKARTYLTSLAFTWAKKKATVWQYEYHFIEGVEVPSAPLIAWIDTKSGPVPQSIGWAKDTHQLGW